MRNCNLVSIVNKFCQEGCNSNNCNNNNNNNNIYLKSNIQCT